MHNEQYGRTNSPLQKQPEGRVTQAATPVYTVKFPRAIFSQSISSLSQSGEAGISLSWLVSFELHINYCNMLDWGTISRLVCRPPPHMCNRFIFIILFWTEAKMFSVFFKQLWAAAWRSSWCWPEADRCKRAGYMSNAVMWLTWSLRNTSSDFMGYKTEQITSVLLQLSLVLMGLFSGV